VIWRIEAGKYNFNEKWIILYNETEALLKTYEKIYTKIKKLDCNNRNFIEKHDKLTEEIHDCIDNMENLFGYATKLINEELSVYAVIENLETDPEKVEKYTKDSDKLSLMLNLYSRLYMVRKRRLTNYYNNLIVDTKFITEMTNYRFNKMNEYLEKNSNSAKGNNMILFGKLTKSKKPKKPEEFKKIFVDYIQHCEIAYELYNKIIMKIIVPKLDCNISLLINEDNIIEKYEYYEKMSKYTLEQFLDELKEPEIEYNTECPICLIEINQKEKCLTKCGHVYCLACATQLLEKKKNTCPMCKEII
jgi:5'-deoxynucleotidase YfbR-like HD superfamily hydrolase